MAYMAFFRVFTSLTFDLSVGNVTRLTTPPQGAVHISFTSTCHDPPIYQTENIYFHPFQRWEAVPNLNKSVT